MTFSFARAVGEVIAALQPVGGDKAPKPKKDVRLKTMEAAPPPFPRTAS